MIHFSRQRGKFYLGKMKENLHGAGSHGGYPGGEKRFGCPD